jgi:ABC-type transport system involved in multi-copper enzyme maturation permease subunit
MIPGPIFDAELHSSAQRSRSYIARVVYGLVLLFFVWGSDPAWFQNTTSAVGGSISIEQMANVGRRLVALVFTIQSIAVLLVTPAIVAGAIADEKRRKTLLYLLASCLSSAEIVLGKLSARLLHIVVFLAVGLPIMILATLFGGVDPALILAGYGGTLSTVVFLASSSILISTLSRRPREAYLLAYMLEAAWLFLPTLIARAPFHAAHERRDHPGQDRGRDLGISANRHRSGGADVDGTCVRLDPPRRGDRLFR